MNETPSSTITDELSRQRLFAMALCDVDEVEPARMVLEDALDTHPGDLDVLGDLAAVYLRAGRYEQCIQTAIDVLATAPDDDESAYALAMALTASGRTDEAIRLHLELAEGARAERFSNHHPELAAVSRAEVGRLRAASDAAHADATA